MLVPYHKKHFGRCVDIFVAAFQAPPLAYDFVNPQNAGRYLRDIVDTPGFWGFVYVLEGTVAAFCLGAVDDYFHGLQYEVKEFAVAPALHGRKVGSLFLTAIETELAGRGVESVHLQTSRAIPAYQFYMRNGFEDVADNVSLTKWLGGEQ